MKTVQNIIDEYRNRHNPTYRAITTQRHEDSKIETHANVSNITTKNGWLEFDSALSTTHHLHKKMHATIIEYKEKI